MSKKKISIKLTPGKEKQLSDATELIDTHYGALIADWGLLTQDQRVAVLADSPVLARLVGMFGRMG